MHLYIFTRGQFDKVRDMMNDLQAQFFEYKTDPHAKQPSLIQLGVRPIQLWEIAFPEPCLQEVMRTIGPMGGFNIGDHRPLMSILGMAAKMKIILGLKDIPKQEPGIKRPIRRIDVDVKAIGIKEDPKTEIEMV